MFPAKSKDATEKLVARTVAYSHSGMDGYELRDHLSQQRLRPIGGYFENFYSSVGSISEEIYSQQAVYLSYTSKPPSQTWRTFLDNHVDCLAAMDFFTVPTARFRVLYVFIVLSHNRRKVLHFNASEHPTAQWTAQQLFEAFPFDSAPRYLLHDRDAIYGEKVKGRIRTLGIEEVITAPRSPWQNAYVERVIGSIRRECLDHVIVLNERHLKRILRDYFNYYHISRTHLPLDKNPPEPRTVEPVASGNIVALPRVGGLHHRYTRIAA